MVERIFEIIENEKKRQQNTIELIASENFVSLNVLKAQGSILTNKYAEGYPKKRYYGGCMFVELNMQTYNHIQDPVLIWLYIEHYLKKVIKFFP